MKVHMCPHVKWNFSAEQVELWPDAHPDTIVSYGYQKKLNPWGFRLIQ